MSRHEIGAVRSRTRAYLRSRIRLGWRVDLSPPRVGEWGLRSRVRLPLVASVLSALGVVLTGCGGTARVTAVVASDFVRDGPALSAVAAPQANGREAPLESVLPLVPSPLPPPGTDCERRAGYVEIQFSNGRNVRYGDCRPRSIDWLHLAVVGEARQWAPRAAARGTTPARIAAATPGERRALQAVLAEMRPTTIRSLALAPLPRPQRFGLDKGDVVLWIGVCGTVRADWEAALFSARYAAVADRLGLRRVGLWRCPTDGSRPGPSPSPPPFEAVRTVVERLHVDVRELRQEGYGVAITLRPRVVAEFLRYRAARFVRDLARTGTRNLYVGVEDREGAIVYAWAGAANEGILYARPDLDSCGPISHSTPIFYLAPPCPVSPRRPWNPLKTGL